MNKKQRKEYMKEYNRKPRVILGKKEWVNRNKGKTAKQTCAKCGYHESWHPIERGVGIPEGCLRFEPQNNSLKTKSLVDHSEASQGLNKCVGVTPENKTEDKEPEDSILPKTVESGSDNPNCPNCGKQLRQLKGKHKLAVQLGSDTLKDKISYLAFELGAKVINVEGFLIKSEKDFAEHVKKLKDEISNASDLPTITDAQIMAFDYVLEKIDKIMGVWD